MGVYFVGVFGVKGKVGVCVVGYVFCFRCFFVFLICLIL